MGRKLFNFKSVKNKSMYTHTKETSKKESTTNFNIGTVTNNKGLRLKLGTKINLMVLAIILLLAVVVGATAMYQFNSGIKRFAVEKARGDLELAYNYIDGKYPGNWSESNGKLYKGAIALNENYTFVDKIGELTGDTVTLFLNDTRISTNVLNKGERAVGTKVSKEVADTVLKKGGNFYGQTNVSGKSVQSAYMPIYDRNENIIGMFYVGASQKIVQETIASVVTTFLVILASMIVLAYLIVYFFTRGLKRRLANISTALDKAGNGDFTTDIIDQSGDELTGLASSFNAMKANLGGMIQEVLKTSEQVASSSEQLTAGAEQTSKATEEISSAIQQVANGAETSTEDLEESSASLEEVTRGIQYIADHSATITEAGMKATEQARHGGEFVKKSADQIQAIDRSVNISGDAIKVLEKRSSEIGDITKVITEIANQTNLLALNAAIEAARAGENGKGFAVVANEVRKLAEQSQHSATQITELISDIQREMKRSNDSITQVKTDVKEGLAIIEKTEESFIEIVSSMEEMGSQIDEMAATSEQIAAGAQEVASTVNNISKITRDSSTHSQSVAASTEEQLASMEEITASATNLATMAMNLQQLVSKFRV